VDLGIARKLISDHRNRLYTDDQVLQILREGTDV